MWQRLFAALWLFFYMTLPTNVSFTWACTVGAYDCTGRAKIMTCADDEDC
jgi:hypothetical protein